MSANIQESESASRKRSHDQFAEGTSNVEAASVENPSAIKAEDAAAINGSLRDIPSVSITDHHVKRERSSSPTVSSGSELSSARTSPSPMQMDLTPSTSPMGPGHANSPSKVPTTSTGASSSLIPSTANPPQSATMPSSTAPSGSAPAKKKRKTAAEKEAEEQERALRKAKKEEELAAKAKGREEREATKAKEREEKEAAKAAKTAEKAKAAAEKEEKERKRKEEEDKKRRAQPSIFGFLKTKPAVLGDTSPNKQPSTMKAVDSSPIRPKAPLSTSAIASPSTLKEVQPEKSAYEKLFQDFYIKSDVKMAPTPFQMDDETMLAKSKILDEYIRGERGNIDPKPFDPVSVFQFSGIPLSRGKQPLAVKKIMTEIFGDPLDSAANNRTESQQVRLTSVQGQLNAIPVKVLAFWEDVRPPYVGTVTSTPNIKLQKLARRPTGRLLKLNYEYDSEAEWEEEEGEDLDDEEMEDEDNEVEEEMGDFLDDAEDVAAARPAFLGDAEPVSTGICFEDRKRSSHNVNGEDCATVYKYRMEFLLESLEHHHSINPFSTEYWQPKVAPATTSCAKAKITSVIKPTNKPSKTGMAPPPPPGSSSATTSVQPDWSTLVPKSLLPDFKRAVVSTDINFLTKVGIVDMLSKRFSTVTKNQVKATLDFVAERSALPGAKKSAKVWVLRPEHALDKD
ncbi:chromatin assembly factor 1 subunit A [Seiridium cupressi]